MPSIKDLYSKVKTMLTKPINELTTPELLEVMTKQDEREIKRQRLVLLARKYHDGEIVAELTERLKQFLGCDEDFTMNYTAMVDDAVSERLMFDEMKCLPTDNADSEIQVEWFSEFWRGNRLGFHQSDIHEAAVSQGEYFGIIDFDDSNNRARITPHKRYTGTTCSGDGEGVVMVYPNGKMNQKPLYALKRWQEKDNGQLADYIAAYLPDRVLTFRRGAIGWVLDKEESLISPRTGEPLGIPVVHYKMPSLRPESKSAWATQRLLNKLITDLVIESDQNAFRLFKFFGWDPRDKEGRALSTAPGSFIGNQNVKPADAVLEAIDGADLSAQDKTVDSFIFKMAGLTSTPAARFQTTGQVAAEGTLKQQEAPLIKKCERRAAGLAIAWEDAATIARRWHNAYADISGEFGMLDETVQFDFKWEPFYAETAADEVASMGVETAKLNNIALKLNMKMIPASQAGLEAGYSETQVKDFADKIESEGSSANDTLARMLNSGSFGG